MVCHILNPWPWLFRVCVGEVGNPIRMTHGAHVMSMDVCFNVGKIQASNEKRAPGLVGLYRGLMILYPVV